MRNYESSLVRNWRCFVTMDLIVQTQIRKNHYSHRLPAPHQVESCVDLAHRQVMGDKIGEIKASFREVIEQAGQLAATFDVAHERALHSPPKLKVEGDQFHRLWSSVSR